jgi:patatin-like phospholipase/acyl hydrolase
MGKCLCSSFYPFKIVNTTYIRGGIRGIVELEILQHIQRELGGKLPIQAFFDLIVGTR